MSRFRRMRRPQEIADKQASIHNPFNALRCLYSRRSFKRNRTAAFTEWRNLCVT